MRKVKLEITLSFFARFVRKSEKLLKTTTEELMIFLSGIAIFLKKKSFKAQYRPVCFARLTCYFGFHGDEASIVHEFYSVIELFSFQRFYMQKRRKGQFCFVCISEQNNISPRTQLQITATAQKL